MPILWALAKEVLAPRRSRGKPANKGWCGQPWHTATRPAVHGLPAPRGRPYAASSGGEVSTQTGSSPVLRCCRLSETEVSPTPPPRDATSPPHSYRDRAPFRPRPGSRHRRRRRSSERLCHRRPPARGRTLRERRQPSGQRGDHDRHRKPRSSRTGPRRPHGRPNIEGHSSGVLKGQEAPRAGTRGARLHLGERCGLCRVARNIDPVRQKADIADAPACYVPRELWQIRLTAHWWAAPEEAAPCRCRLSRLELGKVQCLERCLPSRMRAGQAALRPCSVSEHSLASTIMPVARSRKSAASSALAAAVISARLLPFRISSQLPI